MIDRIMARIFSGILFLGILTSTSAQNAMLNEADSLFLEQKYTQAIENYQDLYKNGMASPSMLLKMAFIQDGLGRHAEALYYLEKYYRMSADRNVVTKIEELSGNNDLQGYRYDDTDYFINLINKYRPQLLALFIALAVLMLVYILRKTKEGEKPIAAPIIQFFVICVILGLNNLEGSESAIIISDSTLLRSGPSAGAEPVDLIKKGHKVKVLGQDAVWTKIVWNEEEVYVRNGKLKLI
ncbi:SH3 domain-containing protein [Ekhidna sp.]|uniref:SH3 domain-containing protein n=1 Tax=Ekhidna sp. TaxID=2608089 RepID=UPI003BAA253B